jgi:hypothetical protein
MYSNKIPFDQTDNLNNIALKDGCYVEKDYHASIPLTSLPFTGYLSNNGC